MSDEKGNEPGCKGNACEYISTTTNGWSDGQSSNGTIYSSTYHGTVIVKWDYGSAFGKAGSMRYEVGPGATVNAMSPRTTGFMDTYTANFKGAPPSKEKEEE